MRIVVVGAGPTGISAAWRLAEHGHQDWLLVEGEDHPGGLATSIRDEAGFTWDLGGHVLFSHYRYFDALMREALGDAWVEHEREAWVWMRERWVPYPLQNNIWRLPADDLTRCLDGLVEILKRDRDAQPPAHFAAWLARAFGTGLCDTFMFPYNFKVWAYTPEKMGVGWMGERVATVDLARVLRNLVHQRDDVSWGPNATFRFPLHGGTGAIWDALAARLPSGRLALGRRLTRVDTADRLARVLGNLVHQRDDVSWGPNATFRFPLHGGTGAIWDALAARLPSGKLALGRRLTRVDTADRLAHFADGTTERYDALVSSVPLDELLPMLSDRPDLSARAGEFVHSSSHIIGAGFTGSPPAELATKCWMYFPEPETPFYRVTVFSNYSPNNVAKPGEQWSLMAEVSESADKPVDCARIVDDTIAGFRHAGFIQADTPIVSTWHRRLEHGYPTPWLARDSVLDVVLPALEQCGIYSRGRFGAWRYEVSNQDHSSMQGVEAVDFLLTGAPETTVRGQMNAEPAAIAR